MPRVLVLNVAEKPSVAKEISRVLSKGSSNQSAGHSKYNPVHKFPFQLQGQQCEMIFTSVTGHLLERDFSASLKSWQSCSPSQLFDEPVYRLLPEVGEGKE